MSISLADVDVRRLSARARATIEEIAAPLADGFTEAELAERLGTTRREISDRVAQLAWEMRAQVAGAEIRDATAEEDDALRESIRELGQLVPAIVDDSGRIIAGHRRARICSELGLELQTIRLADVDTHDAAVAENLVRRHLTPADRRRMIEAELVRAPERSDRAIAATLGVSHPTVAAVRRELQSRGQVVNLSTRVGKDGKAQPSTKPERPTDSDPETRLEYIEAELLSLAGFDDRAHAHARADQLLLEALRELGGGRIADAWEQSGPRYYAPKEV